MKIKFTNFAGRPFMAVLSDDILEIYDQTHNQLMSSYYLQTFLEIPEGSGLNLHGGVPAWRMSAEDVENVKEKLT